MNRTRLAVGVAAMSALTLFTGCEGPKAGAKPAPVKVLMIGNSFSICCLKQLPQVAESMGVELDLASLYIGGCSLERHWQNVLKDGDASFRPYRYGRSVCGRRTVEAEALNVCEALRMDRWDIVTIQQASHFSWRPETYHPFGDDLVAKIRELAPQAKIVVQETWSYTPWDGRLAGWKMDQNEMYAKLRAAYADFAGKYGFDVIPMGTAVQEWRRRHPVVYTENSFGGDVAGSASFEKGADGRFRPKGDVFHLNASGEYLQALVWAAKLFDADVTRCAYRPGFVSEEDARLMKEIAAGLR